MPLALVACTSWQHGSWLAYILRYTGHDGLYCRVVRKVDLEVACRYVFGFVVKKGRVQTQLATKTFGGLQKDMSLEGYDQSNLILCVNICIGDPCHFCQCLSISLLSEYGHTKSSQGVGRSGQKIVRIEWAQD